VPLFLSLFLVAVALSILLAILSEGFIFPHRFHIAIVLCAFWLVAFVFFAIAGAYLSNYEKNVSRHVPKKAQKYYGPRLILFVSAIVTLAIDVLLKLTGIANELVKSMHSYRPAIYAFVVFLILISAFNYLRRFVKGAVSTERLARDFNEALVALVTKEPALIANTDNYVWSDIEDVTPKKADLLARIRKSRKVTFQDLKEATGISLYILAADVIENDTRVFSSDSDGPMLVADAVAASIAIPFAFKPIWTRSAVFYDGGLVSSIPAWIFRRHRIRDPDALTLAMEIAAPAPERGIPDFIQKRKELTDEWRRRFRAGWLARAITLFAHPKTSLLWPLRLVVNIGNTAIYGGRAIELDAIDRLHMIPLRTTFGLLDFDKSKDDVQKEIADIKDATRTRIVNALWGKHKIFQQVCVEIEEDLKRQLAETGIEKDVRFRMFWSVKDGYADSMRIKFTYNFSPNDRDDRSPRPFKASMTGWAGDKRECQFGDKEVLLKLREHYADIVRYHAHWEDKKWCWAIPVFERLSQSKIFHGVLSIEGNFDVSMFLPEFTNQAQQRCAAWSEKVDTDDYRSAYTDDEGPMSYLEQSWEPRFVSSFLKTTD
jgi:predicted acylesterase/phospholipase RssA